MYPFASMTPVSWLKCCDHWTSRKRMKWSRSHEKPFPVKREAQTKPFSYHSKGRQKIQKRSLFCVNVAYLLLCHPLTLPFRPIWWPFPAKRAEWAFTACELNSCSFPIATILLPNRRRRRVKNGKGVWSPIPCRHRIHYGQRWDILIWLFLNLPRALQISASDESANFDTQNNFIQNNFQIHKPLARGCFKFDGYSPCQWCYYN